MERRCARARSRIRVEGVVQGVGFRPFVYSLALRHGLAGVVGNDAGGVFVEVEGDPAALGRFREALEREAPPLAVIEHISAEPVTPAGETRFVIAASRAGGERRTLVSPDTATCADCLRELFDPRDRRYRYPFVNCTNCGPRFTIIRDVPYDRPATTMAGFRMCARCAREYQTPPTGGSTPSRSAAPPAGLRCGWSPRTAASCPATRYGPRPPCCASGAWWR